MELTVVIPAYNEESTIKQTVEEINRHILKARILIINDGSKDKTLNIIKKLKSKHKNLDFISHDKNRGYGAALITGFLKSKTPYVAFLDADLTYHPRYIPLLLDLVKRQDLDCAWGNRFGGKKNKMPFIRKIGNRALVFLFLLVVGRYVKDVSCGERIFTKEALNKIDFGTLPNGLDMITAMTKRIVKRKLKFKLIPIEYFERRGSSKLNVMRDFINMTKNILAEK